MQKKPVPNIAVQYWPETLWFSEEATIGVAACRDYLIIWGDSGVWRNTVESAAGGASESVAALAAKAIAFLVGATLVATFARLDRG